MIQVNHEEMEWEVGLTVQAVLEKDLRKAFYATLLDPLTATVCSTAQIKSMFDELVEAEGDLIAYLK